MKKQKKQDTSGPQKGKVKAGQEVMAFIYEASIEDFYSPGEKCK